MNQPNVQPETDPTEGILSRAWRRPSDIVKAIDSTNLKKYPWGEVSPGLCWPEARLLLFLILAYVRAELGRFKDDERALNAMIDLIPKIRNNFGPIGDPDEMMTSLLEAEKRCFK